MARTITAIAKNFLNLIYPLHCAGCLTDMDPMGGPGICSFCESRIEANTRPYCVWCGRAVQRSGESCADCGRSRPSFDRAWSAYIYEGVLKELLHLFKYRGRPALSGVLCRKLIEFVRDNPEIAEGVEAVTFVPLYEGWFCNRDYNHSAALASAVSGELGMPLSIVLRKIRRTARQNELSRQERLSNLTGAFAVEGASAAGGSKILVIDDVMTTGATLNECAKTLKAAGAKEVRCLTLARGRGF